MNESDDTLPGWDWGAFGRRFALELGPALLFLIAVRVWDIYIGTMVLLATTAVSTVLSWVREKRLPVVPLGALALAGLFGGLTLWLHEPQWIKMRPTVVNLITALGVLGGLWRGRLLVRDILGVGMPAPDQTWRHLSFALVAFLVGLALMNEIVWRTVSTEAWATFKALAIPTLNALFFLGAWWMLRRACRREEQVEA